MIDTESGDVGIKFNGKSYVLRPTINNMSNIGDPQEIVEVFKSVFNERAFQLASYQASELKNRVIPRRSPQYWSVSDAISVMRACCDEDLPDDLTGYINDDLDLVFTYEGMPPNDVIVIARHLLSYGMIGDPEMRGTSGDASSEGFNAKSFITFASTSYDKGLGLSVEDAKSLTMYDFQRIFNSTFPEVKQKQEDDKDMMDAEDFYSAIERKRQEAQNG